MVITETKTVTIYGASDDLVEVDGCAGADEFNGDDVALIIGGRMRVVARYGVRGAVWSFEFGQLEEDVPFPTWPIRLSQHERGYSLLVEVDVPIECATVVVEAPR